MTLMFYMISASIRIRASSGWWVPTSMFGDKANHKPFPLSTFVWLKCLKNLIGLKKPWTFLSCTTEKFHMEMEPLNKSPKEEKEHHLNHPSPFQRLQNLHFSRMWPTTKHDPTFQTVWEGHLYLESTRKIHISTNIMFLFQLIFLTFHSSKWIYH